MAREKLETRRAKAVAKEEEKAGIRDGSTYRVREGSGWRWYRVDVVFYPSARWYVVEIDDSVLGNQIKGTRRLLDDDLKAKFENWL